MSFDPQILFQQIGRGVLMNLGARDIVYSLDDAYVMFRIGAGRPHRKIKITYNRGSDLYDVEIGRLVNRGIDWVVDDTADGIDAESLPEVLLALHHDVAYGRNAR